MKSLPTRIIQDAARHLRAGGMVVFPTETVYGLGVNARDEAAVRRVFDLKGRPAEHPLIVHVADMAAAGQWAATLPDAARVLMERFWPGPLTWVLPARSDVPRAVTGGQDSVALRAPRHAVAQYLLAAFGGGLAAPSANPFGCVSPTEAEHAHAYFPELTVLDGGPCRFGVESTIVSLLGERPRVLRPGALPLADLRAALDDVVIDTGEAIAALPRVPGTLPAHYAPATPMAIVPADRVESLAKTLTNAGLRVALLRRHIGPRRPASVVPTFLMPAAAMAYGRRLYARLREIDRIGFDRLLVEAPPQDEAWWAINDRLARAAHAQPVEARQ